MRKGAEQSHGGNLGNVVICPPRHGMNGFDKHWNFGDGDFGMMGNMEDLKDLGNAPKAMIRDAVERSSLRS